MYFSTINLKVKKAKKRAKKLQEVFSEKYGKYQGRDYNGTVSSRPLFVMRASDPEPIFVELANIRNKKDEKTAICSCRCPPGAHQVLVRENTWASLRAEL